VTNALLPLPDGSQHLTGLIGVVVDGLFAEDDQIGILFFAWGEGGLRGGQRFHGIGGLYQHRASGMIAAARIATIKPAAPELRTRRISVT
jgi:hypothetical protein